MVALMEKKSRCISSTGERDNVSGWIAMLFLVVVAIVAAFILLAM